MGVSSKEFISMREEEFTINTTFKIKGKIVVPLEKELTELTKMIDYKILPETSVLYEKDKTFQKLVKKVKEAQRERDEYINKHK